MNKVKIILVSVLSICIIGVMNAQENQTNKISKKDTVVNCEVKTDVETIANILKSKILKKEVDSHFVRINFDKGKQMAFLSVDTSKIKLEDIEKRLNKKNLVLLIEKEIVKDSVKEAPKIQKEKYLSEIDAFLNSEDTLIFKEKFMYLDDSQLHPRSREYYKLIKNIRTVALWVEKPNISSIRSDLEAMRALIDIIDDPSQSPKKDLPKPLFEYYRSVSNKYFEIYDQIYPE